VIRFIERRPNNGLKHTNVNHNYVRFTHTMCTIKQSETGVWNGCCHLVFTSKIYCIILSKVCLERDIYRPKEYNSITPPISDNFSFQNNGIKKVHMLENNGFFLENNG